MKRQLRSIPKYILRVVFFASPFALISLNIFVPSLNKISEISKPSEERDIYNTFSEGNQQESILDATNPMDLMNRLRRATAMDDATSPSDAIDQALKVFDQQNKISSEYEITDR